MGQCYVGNLAGELICMIETNSLQILTTSERKAVKRAVTRSSTARLQRNSITLMLRRICDND